MSNETLKALLAAVPSFRTKVVDFGGVEVEIREPSNKSRTDLFQKCMKEDGSLDQWSFSVWAVIYNTYQVGTTDLVFDNPDEAYDLIMNMPTGSFLDTFGAAVNEMMSVETSIEDRVKN